ncbi:ditrans,polycis-polyprenyl diphosphate synthase [Kluyveromyces lactis]|uniref:ditrans,polycis-polyprenyl diphosphate synthase [(2E,6E)-farnesyldiphosphate specific] n=1 Tax=Kluyveromyces lactis (strain ATCC 8585 / CBS 2359 / DSM 70799 / NBRC 1267 / NRRL Y-1140 / WM37) TaxID=284590 RepID=Q6CL73_KLULA|nr:uncharacterized protein KLLA0_F05203g [Kluyveromyces lactis]CAG98024.1 KLLA0F05203p [Kluyveromyces lactis]|eukprot:XP_455316.1 uncharacterized protein KLLA0_F05203g [Kluyveromyces lactis]
MSTESDLKSRVPPATKTPLDVSVSGLKKTVTQVMNTDVDDVLKRKNINTNQKFSGKIEYAIYKTLLIFLYVIYAITRYFQREYNRIAIKLLDLAYNPSNSPQLIRQDVNKLQKIPKRLAAILESKPEGDIGGGLPGLINDASDVVCWTVSAGIKHLILYDYDGKMKQNVHELRAGIHHKLAKYFGLDNVPKFAIKIPHTNQIFFDKDEDQKDLSPEKSTTKHKVAVEISLLSKVDGRDTILELTKTMADLCAKGQLKVEDVDTKLVNQELTQLVGHEPDLLLFFGPALDLQGFPPWHIRLTELYWETDNDQVSYYVFIRGLKQYADCKMNVGK